MAYVNCVMDEPDNNFYTQNMNAKEVESMIEHYCLLLPLMDNGNFENEFCVVYHDWGVGDDKFCKVLPNLCMLCFEKDVLG